MTDCTGCGQPTLRLSGGSETAGMPHCVATGYLDAQRRSQPDFSSVYSNLLREYGDLSNLFKPGL